MKSCDICSHEFIHDDVYHGVFKNDKVLFRFCCECFYDKPDDDNEIYLVLKNIFGDEYVFESPCGDEGFMDIKILENKNNWHKQK